jgi:hypothetical protein
VKGSPTHPEFLRIVYVEVSVVLGQLGLELGLGCEGVLGCGAAIYGRVGEAARAAAMAILCASMMAALGVDFWKGIVMPKAT